MKPKNKSIIWELYFFFGGMMSLLYWNSFLNLTRYFTYTISKDIYTYINWSYCLGGIMSFLLSPMIFSNIPNKKAVYYSITLTFAFFSALLFLCQFFFHSIGTKKVLATFGVFIIGFFNCFFQSKIFSIAAGISHHEIWCFSLGNGVMGFISNIIFFIISNTLKEKNSYLKVQIEMYYYYFIVFLFFITYIIIEILFEKNFPDAINDKLEKEIEMVLDEEHLIKDNPHSMGALRIIHRIFDILMGICFLAVSVIAVVSFFVIKTNQVFDNNSSSIFQVPFYMFFFNISECFGRLIPDKYQLKSFKVIHTLNILCIIWVSYYILLLAYPCNLNFLKAYQVRCSVNACFGFTNGYFVNSFSNMAANRFEKKVEKSKAGYFVILFLLLGISIGSFLGFLYNN